MKKLLTLCLALAMTASVGAYALTTLSRNAVTANAADETTAETKTELTVSPTEVYTFVDGSADHTASVTPAVAAWRDKMGMTKFVNSMKGDAKTYIGFDEVDVSDYAFVNFKAWFWEEGGTGKYYPTDIYTTTNVDSGYDISVFTSWADGNCNIYTESSLYVSVPTSAIKNANGKVDGLIIKNSVGSGWFMIGDFVFSNYCYTRVDTANSNSVSGDAKYNIVLQSSTDNSYVKNWKSEELLYKTVIAARADFVTTIKFATPIKASDVDYLRFKVVGWEDSKYAAVTLKNLNGTTVKTLDVYYGWNTTGELNCYLPIDGLKNDSGMIEGFILDCPKATHLLFTDVMGYKGSPEPVVDLLASSSSAGALNRTEWAAIPPTTSEGLLYNGKNIENGTLNVVFKLPVSASVYKTIDFKSLIWNGKDLKDVTISKLDGAAVEIIKMKSGTSAEEYGDLNVKINAELLADESGLVKGFSMTFSNNASGHVVFSALSGNAEEKTYTVTYKADGSDDIIKTFTAANKAAYTAPEVPNKEHYTGAWDKNEITFTEGQVINAVYTAIEYTATFKNGNETVGTVKYTVENKDTVTIPTVPAKDHYTGAWENYELNFDNNQVINAVYTATEYTATFKDGETTVGTVKYTVENKDTVTIPSVPNKEHYTSAWENFELNFDNNQVVNVVYTAIEYTATFKNGNETVGTVKYTVENKDTVAIPTVPAKDHYTGAWENYELNFDNDQVIDAVYTATEYTATFKDGETTVGTVKYTVENKDTVTVPSVPNKEHYTSAWGGKLDLTDNQVINAVHTAIEYTITFKADGETVGTVTYTVENKDNITVPEVPEKSGYTGKWADFEVAYDNTQVVEAEYTKKPEAKKGCKGSASGLGITLAAIGMAAVALKKKRG